MQLQLVDGDLLAQEVDCIVNTWNRNFIPWWLLLPQGVSGAIKRQAGLEPFRELRRYGMLKTGAAVLIGAGKLPFKGIIHVAGLNLFWIATEWSIRESIRNAMALAKQEGFSSIAFPLIGAGTGGKREERVQDWIRDELSRIEFSGEVRLVRFRKQ